MISFNCFPNFINFDGSIDIFVPKRTYILKTRKPKQTFFRHFLILLLILQQVSIVDYGDILCPHPKFVSKHLCKLCNTSRDAFIFSNFRNRHQPYRVRLNHVFGGETYFEFSADGQTCKNVIELKVWLCNMYTRQCQYLGPRCFGRHAMSSGHLFYREIYCL